MQFEIRGHEIEQLLDRLPAGVITLSLDCFDTLIWRAVQAPRDVFCAIDLPGGGVELRMWAEKAAHRILLNKHGRGELALADIYRRMAPAAAEDAVAAMVAHELAAEAEHCFAFAPTVALMRAAKARGLMVVIVSDMYLHEPQLRALIANVAGEDVLALADHVLVSADHGCGKGYGLFDIVLERIGARPHEVLHVGDNRAADFEAPAAMGMHAAHFLQFDAATEQQLRLEAGVATIVDSAVRVSRPVHQFHRAALSLRNSDDPLDRLGHDVLGPAMHAFALWLKEEADALAARYGRPVKPLFLMRDGYLPLKCYEALFPDLGAVPVELSRVAAARAGLTDHAALEAYLHDWIDRVPPVSLVRTLMLQPQEVAAALKHPDEARQRAALAKAVLSPDLSRRILARAAAFAAKLEAHFRAVGVDDGDTVMLIDLGYNGTAQNLVTPMLSERMGLTIAGRYLCLREDRLSGLDKAGLFDVRLFDTRTLNGMTTCVGMVEQLCNVGLGSTIDYVADGSPVREAPELGARQNAARERVQAACLAYVRDAGRGVHRAPASASLKAQARAAASVLMRMMFLPSAAEVALFATFDHDVNLGTRQTVKMLDQADAAEGLRRQGVAYVNNVARMNVPAEIRRHGLPLNLTLLNSMRFALDLRTSDFETDGIDLAVILADATDQMVAELRATPTADGYYRLLVPIGAGRFTAAIPLGRACEHVQIAEMRFERIDDLDAGRGDRSIAAVALYDAMTTLAPDLYAAQPNGLVIVPPPAATSENIVLSLIFRPIRWREQRATAARAA